MGENEKEFILQWDGHAGYVTERFSGLLARQALVDVTLICEEQKLRVHKLVLASCSLYFEEMLEQDLGQEPIIVLKDLNFEVLKAMVEFMYCGETTISQKYLPSLLIAARLFKVNELEFIAKQISESQDVVDDGSSSDKIFEEYSDGSEYVNNLAETDSDCEEMIPDPQNNNDVDCCDIKDNISDTESEKSPSECCRTSNDCEPEQQQHTLYEELGIANKNISETSTRVNGSSVNEMERISQILSRDKFDESVMTKCDDDVDDDENEEDEDDENDDNADDDDSSEKTGHYCCDYSNESRKSSRQQDETDEPFSSDSADVGNKVGQCLKVYTHKKRKSNNKIRNHLLQINELLPELPTTKSIDLLNDSSSDETSLNIENSEYVSSLTSENIQSIVGCTLNEFNLIDSDNEMNVCNGFFPTNDKGYVVDAHKEIRKVEFFTEYESDRRSRKKPILRRSVRLSQQESEESVEDNIFLGKAKKHKIRIVDRERSANLFPKKKRKRHSESTNATTTTSNNAKHSRSLRKTAKLGKYRTKAKLDQKMDKEKVKDEKCEKETRENVHQQLNTIASVNRALWGDMTDISQEINSQDSMECSPSMEIPFAVGLLPLRAALEKMQAMPDYQPRKTRSSVAPVKQDMNSFKRKNNYCEIANVSKKHIASESTMKENAKTVCHIEIRTASQCARSRKRSLSDCPSVEPTAIADK